jgi:RNA polymerase sigma factor (sigma-70 family)
MKPSEIHSQIIESSSNLLMLTRKFTTNNDDSKDLIQETILTALANKDKIRHNANLKGWLYTIMRNTFINGVRKYKYENTVRDNSLNPYILEKVELHTFNNPVKTYQYNEVLQIVDLLPDNLRNPFLMRFKGFKYGEIAIEYGIPLGTVKNRIFQARKMIQQKLAA